MGYKNYRKKACPGEVYSAENERNWRKMSEKIQIDLVVLILLFFTIFGWFLTETLSTKELPEEWELLQIIGEEDKKLIYDSRIENVNRMCDSIRKEGRRRSLLDIWQ